MTRVPELRTSIAFALLAALGCQHGSTQHGAAASSTAGTAPSMTPSSVSAASGSRATKSGAGPGATGRDCSSPGWQGFYMRVRGDGDEQLLTKGLPQGPMMPRPCAPEGVSFDGVQMRAWGCSGVEGERERRSCLLIDGAKLRYYNRDGKIFDLAAKPYEHKAVGDTIDGELETTAPLPGETAPLRVKFHLVVDRNN